MSKIDEKFMKMSRKGAEEMAKNYGMPDKKKKAVKTETKKKK